MTEIEVVEIIRDCVWMILLISLPAMLVGLVVGVVIALIQALTQIQEMTLVFVPKIVAIMVALALFLPFMTRMMVDYGQNLGGLMITVAINK